MTEYEILDLVANNSEFLLSSFSVYLSLISAYLAVGYFVGEKLSSPQFYSLNLLFVYGAAGQTLAQFSTNRQTAELFKRLSELRPLTEYESEYIQNGNIWVAAMGVGVVAALIYMWSVRRPKTK